MCPSFTAPPVTWPCFGCFWLLFLGIAIFLSPCSRHFFPALGFQDVLDDPFFAAAASSPAGAHLSKEQAEQEAQTAALGSDIVLPEGKTESVFDRVAGAPLTLWTIPEISSVGLTEEQALEQGMKKASDGGSV